MVYGLAESGEDIHCQTAGTRVVTCQAIKLMVETDLSLHYVADRSLKDQSVLVASPGAIHVRVSCYSRDCGS